MEAGEIGFWDYVSAQTQTSYTVRMLPEPPYHWITLREGDTWETITARNAAINKFRRFTLRHHKRVQR